MKDEPYSIVFFPDKEWLEKALETKNPEIAVVIYPNANKYSYHQNVKEAGLDTVVMCGERKSE